MCGRSPRARRAATLPCTCGGLDLTTSNIIRRGTGCTPPNGPTPYHTPHTKIKNQTKLEKVTDKNKKMTEEVKTLKKDSSKYKSTKTNGFKIR